MLHAVIMAGGSGTRFWPESRADRPKQLLRMSGERTMIQATVDRLGDLVTPDRTLVATTARLARSVAEQLPELPQDAILVEPCKRDTAPCIGLAAMRIARADPDAVMAVMPSDHVIGPAEVFRDAIRFAAAVVQQRPEQMVTFGIRPTYPAESFGYIERSMPLECEAAASLAHPPAVFHVLKCHEKPKALVARQYLETGLYYWNSGIFVWKAATILAAIERFQPEMYEHLCKIGEAADSPHCGDVLDREFSAIRPISIDFGVMEHVDDVVVVEAPFDWDDVGSWRSLERLRPLDRDGNVIDAARYLGLDTSGTIVRGTNSDNIVVTVGVKDLIVIVTPDATLVADKHDEESIRRITGLLEDRGWKEYL